ncbi:hypothetical protein NPIL_375531 [Nephila pilipes]|uniref:Uncharacterized protein n=1 Tax=Nephila pilipes TaxID=299642 RepID=A0A8X6MVU9_NEPPI|nr:hypothetical protein NPIL_375531 [Nephila pilipes]
MSFLVAERVDPLIESMKNCSESLCEYPKWSLTLLMEALLYFGERGERLTKGEKKIEECSKSGGVSGMERRSKKEILSESASTIYESCISSSSKDNLKQ